MLSREELYHFVPGEVVLHLEHDENVNDDNLLEAVTSFLNLVKAPWNPSAPSRLVRLPMTHFGQNKEISFVLINFNTSGTEPYEDHVYENQHILIDELIEIYKQLNNNHDLYILKYGVTLIAISPNWLASGSPHQPGVGGPGSWPVQAERPTGDVEFPFKGTDKTSPFIRKELGMNVEVAILDTTPWTHSFMMHEEHKGSLEKPKVENWSTHEFLKELLGNDLAGNGSDGKLEIIPYSRWNDFCFSLAGHSYLMPDHGLFVAGIIHSIAPMATLKLYEVLNPYGAGSYESIYNGLKLILDRRKTNTKLVINMSLVLDIPTKADESNKEIFYEDKCWVKYNRSQAVYYKNMTQSIHILLKKLANLQNVVLVAAAGNNWDGWDYKKRPSARYPAAHPGVIGVGGLPKHLLQTGPYRAANYSNLCDDPIENGCMTLGGEAGVGKGIQGVYIHPFPVLCGEPDRITYMHNDTGWAWWAGTSFAAPIISGLFAAAMSNNVVNSIQVFLDSLSEGITDSGERAIIVTQT